MFEGLIWFIIPIMMVVLNDVMAYMFGFFFGRTPLIQLSPKKTWEGFVGGGVSTVFMSMGIAYFMCQYNYFVCPIGESQLRRLLEVMIRFNCNRTLASSKVELKVTLYLL